MNEKSAKKPAAPKAPWTDPAQKPFVQLIGVSKSYGATQAVNDVSLDIYEGEFFALLGPSGCGKTTLLRMLAGFEAPSAGAILLDGENIIAVPPYLRPVNMMFQSYALFPHLSVEGNVAFGLKQERLGRDEIRRRVYEVLDLVQLNGYGKRKPEQLSGGQRQRVALARCLVKQPKILLLDEPLGALDKKLREQTQFELMNIQEKLGITFVVVTHDQEEAMTVASRIAVMDHGRIAQVATPAEIYEAPNSRYVAEFIGDVNLFEGRVAAVNAEHLEIGTADFPALIRCRKTIAVMSNSRVWIALRPEKLNISRDPPDDPAVNCLSGVVWDIAYLGNSFVYHIRLDNGRTITSLHANKARTLEHQITWEDRVYLTWRESSAVLLTQ